VEVHNMLHTLHIEPTEEQFEKWVAFADEKKTGKLTRDNILKLLMCNHFIGNKGMDRLLFYMAKHNSSKDGQIADVMMEGVTHRHASDHQLTVKDRITGLEVKENIPGYISVALKTMFSTGLSRAISGGKSAQHLMTSVSIKEGKKFDTPKSAEEIPAFVKLHGLNVDEMEKPLSEYKTFNEFFSRKLKAGARPIAEEKDGSVAVCPADCRMMVFKTVLDATKFWVKGNEFTLDRLFGSRAAELCPKFQGGSFVIARLAPQDYHRWHVPVNGTLVKRTPIAGALYTVNPIAINKNVNVYTTNKREILEHDSPEFGKVVLIAVGATMVGTISVTTPENQPIAKGECQGYFSFGGSTVLCFFEPGAIEFDADLLANSNAHIETLVRVGLRLGKCTRKKK